MRKIIIGITSYNRYDKVVELIKQCNHKVVLINDCSTDIRYNQIKVDSIVNEYNYGKKLYYKTINKLFSKIKSLEFDYFIQLDDDFVLCENFDLILSETLDYIEKKYTNFGALSLHLNSEYDLIKSKWNLGINWIDGGTLFSKKLLDDLNYNVNPIPLSRWNKNENLSSGVWQQVSKRINNLGYKILKPSHSFLKHNYEFSKMNKKEREINPLKTYNFINKKDKIKIYYE